MCKQLCKSINHDLQRFGCCKCCKWLTYLILILLVPFFISCTGESGRCRSIFCSFDQTQLRLTRTNFPFSYFFLLLTEIVVILFIINFYFVIGQYLNQHGRHSTYRCGKISINALTTGSFSRTLVQRPTSNHRIES